MYYNEIISLNLTWKGMYTDLESKWQKIKENCKASIEKVYKRTQCRILMKLKKK